MVRVIGTRFQRFRFLGCFSWGCAWLRPRLQLSRRFSARFRDSACGPDGRFPHIVRHQMQITSLEVGHCSETFAGLECEAKHRSSGSEPRIQRKAVHSHNSRIDYLSQPFSAAGWQYFLVW